MVKLHFPKMISSAEEILHEKTLFHIGMGFITLWSDKPKKIQDNWGNLCYGSSIDISRSNLRQNNYRKTLPLFNWFKTVRFQKKILNPTYIHKIPTSHRILDLECKDHLIKPGPMFKVKNLLGLKNKQKKKTQNVSLPCNDIGIRRLAFHLNYFISLML